MFYLKMSRPSWILYTLHCLLLIYGHCCCWILRKVYCLTLFLNCVQITIFSLFLSLSVVFFPSLCSCVSHYNIMSVFWSACLSRIASMRLFRFLFNIVLRYFQLFSKFKLSFLVFIVYTAYI